MDIIMKWVLLSRPSEMVLGTQRSKKYILKTAEKGVFSQRLSTDLMGTCRTTCSNEMTQAALLLGKLLCRLLLCEKVGIKYQ